MDEKSTALGPAEPVVESASATTSRANADSGPTAYVVFGAAVVFLLALTMSLASCASSLVRIAAASGVLDEAPSYGSGDGSYDPEALGQIDELVERFTS